MGEVTDYRDGRKTILFDSSHASLACSSDQCRMKIKALERLEEVP
jgi:hypothetical protein